MVLVPPGAPILESALSVVERTCCVGSAPPAVVVYSGSGCTHGSSHRDTVALNDISVTCQQSTHVADGHGSCLGVRQGLTCYWAIIENVPFRPVAVARDVRVSRAIGR